MLVWMSQKYKEIILTLSGDYLTFESEKNSCSLEEHQNLLGGQPSANPKGQCFPRIKLTKFFIRVVTDIWLENR